MAINGSIFIEDILTKNINYFFINWPAGLNHAMGNPIRIYYLGAKRLKYFCDRSFTATETTRYPEDYLFLIVPLPLHITGDTF